MFGHRNIPKSQAPDKSPFTIYNPHSKNLSERKWGPIIKIISIDPGTINYCIRIEERSIDPNVRFRPTTLLYDKFRLKKKDLVLTAENECLYYTYLLNYFDQHLDLFKQCHLLIVERQMPFNYKATRIAQHTLTYFMTKLKDLEQLPLIVEIDSKLKGKELNAPKNLNKNGLKQWAVEEATKLLNIRNDKHGLDLLKKHRKKDDLADTLCQIEAFFSYMNWPLTCDILPSNNDLPRKIVLNIIK